MYVKGHLQGAQLTFFIAIGGARPLCKGKKPLIDNSTLQDKIYLDQQKSGGRNLRKLRDYFRG